MNFKEELQALSANYNSQKLEHVKSILLKVASNGEKTTTLEFDHKTAFAIAYARCYAQVLLTELNMKNRNLDHKDDWATPPEVFVKLNEEFDFTFDPCPYQHDIEKWDGLNVEWGERNFINPPYSRKLKDAFVKKAISESKKGKLCVMLLPVSTSTKLFHDEILPNQKEIRFFKGRIKFCGVNTFGEYVTGKAGMHDSMLVVFDGRYKLAPNYCVYAISV